MNELEHLYFASKTQRFVIDGKLDGLNAYTKANRSNRYAGAKMKKDNETVVMYYIKKYKIKKVKGYPIKLKITWVESNMRRDLDNIAFATKFILDSMVKLGIIENDNQKYVTAIEHTVKVEREHPRIEVCIVES